MSVNFQQIMEEAMNRKLGEEAWDKRDVDIIYSGSKITLPGEPGPMPTRKAIEALERKEQDELTIMSVHEVIDAHPHDALVAFNEAMRQKYGWSSPRPTMSFFGPLPPELVTVQVGPEDEDTVQVPAGEFTLPGVENSIKAVPTISKNGPVLAIIGKVRKRESAVLKELARLTREILRERSIYKGKAIRMRVNEDGTLSTDAPTFIATKHINPDELVLNPDELTQVRAGLWAPIMHTQTCIDNNIPLNRGVLLEGPYGTGKTMTANVTAKVCEDNGWTYILLDDVRALKDALLFAQRYQPAVVFAEDADRVAEHRDQRGNDLLNVIDGVLTKSAKVITVLTTNHVEKLNQAMLRPGRLDSLISVQAPQAEAVQRLVRLYARDMLPADTSLTEIGSLLEGNIPATIREVVERSKLTMLMEGRDMLTEADLRVSAISMTRHLELLTAKPDPISDEEKLGQLLTSLIRREADASGMKTFDLVDELNDYVHENI